MSVFPEGIAEYMRYHPRFMRAVAEIVALSEDEKLPRHERLRSLRRIRDVVQQEIDDTLLAIGQANGELQAKRQEQTPS